jgi:polysaccharide biosynthesis protein PslG
MRDASGRRRWVLGAAALLVAAGVVVALVVSSGPPAGRAPVSTTPTIVAAQPPPTSEQFGANVGRLFNDRSYAPGEIDAQLAALRDTGASVARSDALWEATEPAGPSGGVHHYDWAFDDVIAAALAAHGLQWLPIIDYSAPWAQSIPGTDHSPPTSQADYAAYAGALAQRYGPGGSFWAAHPELQPEPVGTYEIWNEPDNPVFWSPTPNAAQYAELYLRARAAIDAVQPGARVIVGGLTRPASFTAAMLAAAPPLREQLDGIAIHPYAGSPAGVLDNVRSARLGLDSLGLASVPLYVTEFGWTTYPARALDYVPEQLRPGYIERTVAALGHLDCGVAAEFLYAWVTPERNPSDAQDWFGIHPPAGGTSPDSLAFSDGLRAAATPGATISLCSR